MSKARLSYLFGMRALFLPPRKKEKKKDQPLHELSQTRMSWPRSQIVCSAVFLTSKHSVFLHKGFHGHVEFLMQKKVGETETLFPTEWVIGKKKSGREGEKENTSCMSPLLIPTSQTQNQTWWLSEWSWAPLWNACAERKFLVCLSNALPPTKKDNCYVTKLAEYFCLS